MSLSERDIEKLRTARKTALIKKVTLYLERNLEGLLSNRCLFPKSAGIISETFVAFEKNLAKNSTEHVQNK